MLPRAERLTKSGLYQRTHAGRKSVSTPLLALYVLERQPKSAPRLPFVGFVVGRKVHAGAVQRNRAKRRVREAYRLLRQRLQAANELHKYNLDQWYSLVWHIRAEVNEAPFEEICSAVEQCLAQAAARYGRRSKAKADG